MNEQEGPECDQCGAENENVSLIAGEFYCDYCRHLCDSTFIPAVEGTGVSGWEVSPCLQHYDPRDQSSYTEKYETINDAEDDEYEGTGAIFWGVYAVMRERFHSGVIKPVMHLADFDSPKDAQEFVRAMGGVPAGHKQE